MYRKILVGYKHDERGADALALAQLLASAESVVDVLVVEALPAPGLLHPHPHPVDGAGSAAGAAEDRPPGVQVVRAERGASVADTLTAVAEREAVDLVVLGSTHRGFAGRVLVGTTAGSLLPDAPCTVVVAPVGYAGSAAPLREIAVAFDGSDEARAALEWGAALAAATAAHLRLLAVITPPPPIDPWVDGVPGEAWGSGLSYPQTVEVVDALREQMEHELASAAAAAGCATDTVTTTVVGDPDRELRNAAAEVDMLVVGSHRGGALSGVLFGSVSRGLAHHCPAPLAVVPGNKPSSE